MNAIAVQTFLFFRINPCGKIVSMIVILPVYIVLSPLHYLSGRVTIFYKFTSWYSGKTYWCFNIDFSRDLKVYRIMATMIHIIYKRNMRLTEENINSALEVAKRYQKLRYCKWSKSLF